MKTFEGIKFNGTFRNYQQRVLDSCDKYLNNNKIHIVAAPGSGKTILGLELMRRMGAPAIVLSPTNTIRYQWGDRFESMFLTDEQKIEDYVSYDLNNLQLITSITYQALHSCIDKIACIDEEGNEIDYSQIDLFKIIKEMGIKTICLDEAHHLQNEWQRALSIFIKGIDASIKVVALTATPPYDATPTEWNRYISTCGEIDEEIFVTELVKCKNLCPHQDYIYFNYPTMEESAIYNKFKENIELALNEVRDLQLFEKVPKKLYKQEKDILDNAQSYVALIGLLQRLGVKVDLHKLKKLLPMDVVSANLESYECALNFILESKIYFSDEQKLEILQIFKKYKLTERNKVKIVNNEKTDKNLIYSLGKLESINSIVACEYGNLKNDLRMLVLTDFIKKNDLSKINTNALFKDISIVSIFESIRRCNGDINIAVLSGSLVILPSALEKETRALLGDNSKKLKTTVINDSDYSEYVFAMSNKEKVAVVGKLFEEGKISIVVGTKSLLGEGWDSPCINSLIMASYVGSFMLSNQMRGRAIRVFKNDPNKTANIWHLVTLEPENAGSQQKIICDEETSADYKTLKRRFGCFVGPHYSEKSVENGIERISVLKQSYTPACVKEINAYMENASKNRGALASKWDLSGSGVMYMQTSIPKSKAPKKLAIINGIFPTLFLLFFALLTGVVLPHQTSSSFLHFVLYTIFFILLISFMINLIKTIIYLTPTLFIYCMARGIKLVLQEFQVISENSKIKIKNDKKGKCINVLLISQDVKEQKCFSDSLFEIFAPIKDSRYVICKTLLKGNLFEFSYQIPKLLATNINMAKSTLQKLNFILPAKLIYNSVKNKKNIYRCMKYSYINSSGEEIKQKQVMK